MKKLNRLSHAIAVVSLVGLGSSAQADSYSKVIEAPVVSVDPIVQVREDRIPFERCRTERVRVEGRGNPRSFTPAVLGGVLGGAAGSVLGDNSSRRDLITGAGVLLGASVGNDIEQRRRQRNDGYYVTEDVCTTEYEIREREQVSGYRVRYRFEDSIYETRTAVDPGSTIAVRMRLEPLP
ncbi:MAG: glycine zipper 2TM domain-containing protein [Pseudomonadota bacterium]